MGLLFRFAPIKAPASSSSTGKGVPVRFKASIIAAFAIFTMTVASNAKAGSLVFLDNNDSETIYSNGAKNRPPATSADVSLASLGTKINPGTFSSTFSVGTNSGTITSSVYQLGNLLSFVYTLTMNTGSATQLALQGFGGFFGPDTAVGYITGTRPAGTQVMTASSTPDPSDTISFNWVPPTLTAPNTSASFVVQVKATSYKTAKGTFTASFDGGSGNILAPNPEPTTMILAAIGFVPLAGLIRARRRRDNGDEVPATA